MSKRCVDGVVYKHRPFPDDPDFEYEIGPCPNAGKDGKCDLCKDDASQVGASMTKTVTPAHDDRYGHGDTLDACVEAI